MKMPVIGRCPCEGCPSAGDCVKLTRHHVFPIRWWRFFRKEVSKEYINSLFWLCRACHDRLETTIMLAEKHEAYRHGKQGRMKKDWLWYPYIVREHVLAHGATA